MRSLGIFTVCVSIAAGHLSSVSIAQPFVPPPVIEPDPNQTNSAEADPLQPQLAAAPDEAGRHGLPPVAARPETMPEQGIALEGILDLAIKQNPSLVVARARVGESEMRSLASGLLPNPEVVAGVKEVTGNGSGGVFEITQELPVNRSRDYERRAARLDYEADRADLSREIQVILRSVETAYVQVLAAREVSQVERRGMEVAGDSLALVSETLKAGLVSSLPYSLALTEFSNAKNSRLLAEKEFQLARQELAALLGMEEASLSPVAGDLHESLLPPSTVPENRHDLRAAGLRVQAADSSVASARRERIPNPVLGFSREETDTETEEIFSVGIRVPLFNSGKPEVRHRMAARQTANSEKAALERAVQAERAQAETRLESKREAARLYETEIRPSVEKALEAASSAFRSGTADLSLLLQTQTRLIDQERNYVRALRDLRLAEVEYLLAAGRMGRLGSSPY